jgi:Mrp family chromosome partitioning ATPase
MHPLKTTEERALNPAGSELMIRQMSEPVALESRALEEQRIIDYTSPHGRVVQSFRTLRTMLLQQAGPENFITLVTSVGPQNGTSFVARNLAAALAFDRTRTALLIDCNRDSPSVDYLLNGRARFGLTDLLEEPGKLGIGDVIYGTGVPRLRAIPVGHHRDRPVEYFTTPRMQAFMDIIRQRYPDRYIVVDAPAVQTSADARILSDWCDYVIIVARYGEVTREELLEAAATIPAEKFVGVVFNDFGRFPEPSGIQEDEEEEADQ